MMRGLWAAICQTAMPLISRPQHRAGAAVGLDEVLTANTLRRAWVIVRTNHGCAGGDGVDLVSFGSDLDRQLDGLRAAVMQGSYRPGALRRVTIPKPDGRTRVLAIPCVGDRVLQTAVKVALEGRLEPHFHPASFGYRPGRSVAGAVACVRNHIHAGFRWAVDADIQTFFESINHRHLIGDLKLCAEPDIVRLVGVWLAGFAPGGRGIAQGSPLSPLLANLFLDPVDRRLDAAGIRFVRYADDLTLLAADKQHAQKALNCLRLALRQRGLALNHQKTAIVPPGGCLHFLGEAIGLS